MDKNTIQTSIVDNSSKEEILDDTKDQTHHSITSSSGDDVEKVYPSRGVERIENVKETMDNSQRGKTIKTLFFVSILVCAWIYSLDSSTTYNYSPSATSAFGKHSMLSTVSIATNIMSSVCKPILAKIADITSRPMTYILSLTLYVLGYIIVASSSTISAYVVGEVFVAIGGSGIQLMNKIIAADLTPLKYRGLLLGIMGSPYLINTWFAGLIVESILDVNWRWGYGMFAIIMPVAIVPSVCIMLYLDHKAQKNPSQPRAPSVKRTRQEWASFIWQQILEVDLFGLILMGFGWSLLLLPFSLYANADNHWKNPSLIAMLVVGALCLIAYAIYEIWWAPYPSMPKRVLFNRTFCVAAVIDFFHMCAGMLRLLYFSSYVWIIKNWSTKNWTYFNNTLTMSLCFFGVVVGIILRITHRVKYIQVFGLALKVVGQGLTVWARDGHYTDVTLVMTQILLGIGGACSVVGSQVASQASVPHQDMALVIALLSQWSNIGYAIGSAIAGAIWSGKMRGNLRKYMPDSVSDAQVDTFYGSITKIRQYPYDSEIRQAAIKAYSDTAYFLFVPALSMTVIPFLVSFLQRNYYLGDSQNAVENTKEEKEKEKDMPIIDKILNFFNKPINNS